MIRLMIWLMIAGWLLILIGVIGQIATRGHVSVW